MGELIDNTLDCLQQFLYNWTTVSQQCTTDDYNCKAACLQRRSSRTQQHKTCPSRWPCPLNHDKHIFHCLCFLRSSLCSASLCSFGAGDPPPPTRGADWPRVMREARPSPSTFTPSASIAMFAPTHAAAGKCRLPPIYTGFS